MKTKRKGFVEPIPMNKIRLILDMLEAKGRERDLLLVRFGLNTGLRSCDWLDVTLGDLRALRPDENLFLHESKTTKMNPVVVNKGLYDAVQRYLATVQDRPDSEYAFKSKKGRNKRITRQHCWHILKEIAREAGCTQNIGLHSLRKSFAHNAVLHYGIPVEIVSEALNHSSPRITRNYACIPQESVRDARRKVNF
jgi:site-specific recombinase XerD